MKTLSLAMSVALAGLLASACAGNPDKSEVRSAHEAGKGSTETYDATFDQIWAATHAALQWNDAGRPIDHVASTGESYVLTDPNSRRPNFDAEVGVWIDPMNTTKTRVNVVVINLTGDQLNMGGPNEVDVQKDIAKAVAMVRDGKTLPNKRP